MGDIELAALQLADHAQRLSAFTGVTKPNARDRFFLVMGMTGSGKSTFVSRCTGKDATVSHGLYSCMPPIVIGATVSKIQPPYSGSSDSIHQVPAQ